MSKTVDLVSAPEEKPDEYRLTKSEQTTMMNETDFIKQIEENMKYPDNYVEMHVGLSIAETNLQVKDDENGDIGLVQIGFDVKLDKRSNSFLSHIGLSKLDLCLGSKRNLKSGSLFNALLTPLKGQIDVETDSVDMNKNHIRIHDVGTIELLFNRDIIRRNAMEIERLFKNIKQIVDKKMKQNLKRIRSKSESKQQDPNEGVVAIEEDLENMKRGGNVEEQYVVQRNDLLLVKSRKEGVLYFVSLQSVNGSRDYPQTSLVGYWVTLQLQTGSDSEGYVFVRDENQSLASGGNAIDGVVTIRLQNIMRNVGRNRKIRRKYARFSSKRQTQGNGWIVTDKEAFLKHLQSIEEEKLYNAQMLELE